MGSHPAQRPDWANLQVLHRNTLPPRADFNTYTTEQDALARDVSKAKACSLAGRWKFHLANSPFDAPDGFEAPSFDTSKWSDIQVPSMWQMKGFGKGPQYVNVQFPFFVDPPYPPYDDNETGSYVTKFTIPKTLQDDQIRIRFEGVDSAYHVWVNGKQIGYSQGSRNPAEFDITEHVNLYGENLLAVRVYQYCDASYIEDQDQWRISGIFRDVFLLGFPKQVHFQDFTIETDLDQNYRDATLKVQVELSGSAKVDVKLLDAERKPIATDNWKASRTSSCSIPVKNPHKWTAETPYLYDLVIALDGKQFVAHRVGFRKVELKDGLIKVNGQRIVIKGANRHEHHPLHGRSIPYEFMKQDLLLMKTHNINAIRTCHQPADVRMYDLADELGLWVMDEADVECHGFETIADAALTPEQRALPFFERQQLTKHEAAKWTSDNEDWHDAYVDRAQQLVFRDKLHPSVIMWSLGNESFYGRNHTAMTEWIRSCDSTRLIHYEPDLEAEHMDMHSRMYPHMADIIAFGEDKSRTKPLVLCEYIHAMGTGPGNIKEYIDAFYDHPKLQGGWVWEWANHGLLTKTKDDENYYGYGGDFGDVPNDGNFVMDGMLDSDHTPNSGLVEYKKALEPIQLVEVKDSKAVIINRLDFDTLDHLTCQWSLVREGGIIDTGSLEMPQQVQAGNKTEIPLPKAATGSDDSEQIVELSFQLKDDTKWAKAGHEVAFLQIPMTPLSAIREHTPDGSGGATAEATSSELAVSGGASHWTISLSSGGLRSWRKNGKELIAQELQPSFFRAPTDNDAPQDGRDWSDRELHLASIHTRSINWRQDDGNVVVQLKQKFGPKTLSWSLDLTSELTFSPTGTLQYVVKGVPAGINLPKTLPLIGVTLGLPGSFQQVQWFGRGPGESYRDMKLSQRVGLHSVSKVDDLWAGPEYPQECSNRTDTRWLKLSSSDLGTVTAQFFKPGKTSDRHLFDFMASHYDGKDIAEAKHPYELEKKRKDFVVLRLDADHHGLGTGSCGPKTLQQYALKTEPFEFGLMLS